MVKKEREVRFFKVRPETEKEQMALAVFHFCNAKKSFTKESLKEVSVPAEFIEPYVDLCVEKNLITTKGDGVDTLMFNAEGKKVMGIGFRGSQCFLTVMGMNENIVAREDHKIEHLTKGKGKDKDIVAIARAIADQTRLKDMDIACCGVAVPEEMINVNPKSVEIMAENMADIFNCTIFATTSATASGYGDRNFCRDTVGKNVLYMYSDVGIGVVLKKESVFEANEYGEIKYGSYLRPWNQFSIVDTTKDLVSRGVGTEIVEMVKGDIEGITMDVVLKAADRKDELAEDLVQRSGLALGVRVAYLVNMFNVEIVIFGGGTEKDEGGFIECVKGSMAKFLPEEVMKNLKIIPGVLGKESSSIGAAALCRREMFMEV